MKWIYHILLIHLHIIGHLSLYSSVTSNGVLETLMFMNVGLYNNPEIFVELFLS